MLIPIVDDSDIQIDFKERADVAHPDVYRVSALWLTNTRGDILITQRAFSKKIILVHGAQRSLEQ